MPTPNDHHEPAGPSPGLHLGKFATPEAPATGEPEGATIIIKRAAVQAAAKAADPAAPASADTELPLGVMLGLISYCYARGIFRSDDIARRLREDPELARSFGKELPDGPAIRRFRRRHSDEIEETLETLYRELPQGGEADTVHIQRQARDRVHDAAFTDNTSR